MDWPLKPLQILASDPVVRHPLIKRLVCLASLATRINSCSIISTKVSVVFVLHVGIFTVSDPIVSLWPFFCHEAHQEAHRSVFWYSLGWCMWHWWWFLFIEEDRYDSYSRMLLKYFLAEGVVCGHQLFLASARDHPDEIMQVRIKSCVHTRPVWHFGQVFWFCELLSTSKYIFYNRILLI